MVDPDPNPNPNPNPNLNPGQAQVAVAAVKLPPFWKNNPALWFCQVESQFEVAGIRTDATKFNYIVGKVESNVLSQVSDIILNRPEANMYTTLKNRILQCFAESAESKLKRLLNEISLDGKRPSNLLREMKELAGAGVTDDVLKSLWMQRLPVQVQTVLAGSRENLIELSQLADRVIDVTYSSNVNVVDTNQNQDLTKLFDQINILRSEISELRKSRSNDRENNSHSNNRSRSKSSNRRGICFYHYRFKDKAHKCIKPCNYNEKSSESGGLSNQGN